jgi:F-type H+-transporting ATPase subunit a
VTVVANRTSTKRTLLISAVVVLVVDVLAVLLTNGEGLIGFPGTVIRQALEPIVPHAVINLGSEEHHAAALIDFYPSITGSIIMTWIVMAIVILLFALIARKLTEIPGKVQNALEFAIEALSGFAQGIGGLGSERYLPLFLAVFIFIVASNWSGLIPGVGRLHAFRAPTSDVNVTVGMALVMFGYFHYQGMRVLGIRQYFGKFFSLRGGPVGLFVGLIEFLLEFVKPVALSMRLFGNIYGGELALTVMTTITFAFIPVALYGLELFVGLMQGIIFSVLVLVFTMLATEGHHEEGHEEHPAKGHTDAGVESKVAAQ